ncbi:MFS transporter [Bacillus sp. ISL-18]|uniref:MFS transporter n=1 Tax=Bacillus sp. ISL-18 TaxID=2819118 RepID=UPI001BE93D15|nr:MFS transporter [Bacillus sp. ISL-18]MBT2654975.1 MFS transporter [Bacillus sp. ISL-18]
MEKRRFWSYENKLVTIFFFSIGFVFFDRLAINYLVPFIQKDFALTNTQIGLIGSALAITWAISGPLGGYLSDRVKSPKIILAIFIFAFSLVSLLQGFAASFAMILILRLLMGVLEGPITPITQSILAIESSEKRRGFNMGFTMNTGNAVFGSFLAPLIIVGLANAFDWRTAFYLTIIPGIILAIFIMKSVKNPDKGVTPVNSPAASREKVGFKEVMKHRNIWLSVVIFSFFMIYVMAFNIFGPTFLVNYKHLSSGTMSIIMAAFGAGFAIFGIVVPAISDRIGRKPTTLIFGVLSIFTPLAVVYLDSVGLIIALVFLFSSGMGVGALVMSVIPAESVPLQYAGVTVGLTIGIGEIFGGVLNPVLSGMAADAWGLTAPLLISSSAAVLAFIFSLFIQETAPVRVQMNNEMETTVKV